MNFIRFGVEFPLKWAINQPGPIICDLFPVTMHSKVAAGRFLFIQTGITQVILNRLFPNKLRSIWRRISFKMSYISASSDKISFFVQTMHRKVAAGRFSFINLHYSSYSGPIVFKQTSFESASNSLQNELYISQIGRCLKI